MSKPVCPFQYIIASIANNVPVPNNKDVQALMDTDPTKAMKVGLMMFQKRHSDWGLEMTGEMDDQTMELMCMGRRSRPE